MYFPRKAAVFALAVVAFSLISTAALAPVVELKSYPTEGISDLRVYGSASDNYGTQIKFNISTVPAGLSIVDADICFYFFECYGSLDDDISAWRVDDQTWGDTLTVAHYNAQVLTTSTNTSTLNSTTCNTYTCFDVTAIVAAGYAVSDDFVGIRIEDPDYPLSVATGISYQAENVLGRNPSTAYYKIDTVDGNGGGPGNKPVLRIEYSAPLPTTVFLDGAVNITYDAEMTAYCHSTYACTLLRNGTDVTADENDTAVLLHRGGYNYTAVITGNSTQSWAVVAMPAGGVCALPVYGIKVEFISEKLQILVR
jgi:hypothetical protein